MSDEDIDSFIQENNFSDKNCKVLKNTIQEARGNGFGLFVVNADEMERQAEILTAVVD